MDVKPETPRPKLIRKSILVDERMLRAVRRALGVATDAEAIRLSIERVVEMEAFWRRMERGQRGMEEVLAGEAQ